MTKVAPKNRVAETAQGTLAPPAQPQLTQDQMKALFVLRVIETSQCSASDQMQHNLLAAKNWLHQIAQGKAVVVAPVA